MNYIISGGLGFIGRNLIDTLNGQNKDFAILDKLADCDVCKADIRIPECQTFIHLAAKTNIRDSLLCPCETINENINSTLNVLEYARETDPHFIFTSSMGAPQALSPYSASKLACEAIINSYRETYGVNTTILRLSSVYGPHSEHKNSVIAKFIKSCLAKEPLKIYGNGLQTRDFICVEDVVNTILTCSGPETIDVCTGRSTNIIYIAELIRDLSTSLLNFIPEIKLLAPIKGEITEIEPSSHIAPTTILETGIERTFKWFIKHSNHL